MKLITILLLGLVVGGCGQTGRTMTEIPSSTDSSSASGGFGSGTGSGGLGSLTDAAKTLSETPSTGDAKTDAVIQDSASTLDKYADTATQVMQSSQSGNTNQAIQYAKSMESLRAEFPPLVDRLNNVGMDSLAVYFSNLYSRNPVWRFVHTSPNKHLYSTDLAWTLAAASPGGYRVEGVAFQLYRNPGPNRVAVKECVNTKNGIIFLSVDPGCEGLADADWGIVGYGVLSQPDGNHLPMYRAWNPADNDIVSTIWDAEIRAVAAAGYQVVFQGFWVPHF